MVACDAERLGGISRDTLVTPKLHQFSKDSGFLFDTLGPDHPMNTTYAYLQQMAYESFQAWRIGPGHPGAAEELSRR